LNPNPKKYQRIPDKEFIPGPGAYDHSYKYVNSFNTRVYSSIYQSSQKKHRPRTSTPGPTRQSHQKASIRTESRENAKEATPERPRLVDISIPAMAALLASMPKPSLERAERASKMDNKEP
jgi:hypothetical protein